MNIDTQCFVPVYTKILTKPSEIMKKYLKKISQGRVNQKWANVLAGKIVVRNKRRLIVTIIPKGKWLDDYCDGKFSFPVVVKIGFLSCQVAVMFDGDNGKEIRIYKASITKQLMLKDVFFLGSQRIEDLDFESQVDVEIKKSEKRTAKKAEVKTIKILFSRIKKESASLISMVEEETIEMIEALRQKATEIYNKFGRWSDFDQTTDALEEILSDLLTIKEMVTVGGGQVTYSDLLGVSVTAGTDEIKKAYRAIMKMIHPDIAKGNGANLDKANSLSEIINIAYANLVKN